MLFSNVLKFTGEIPEAKGIIVLKLTEDCGFTQASLIARNGLRTLHPLDSSGQS
ncbi:hypothetical protein ACIQ2D_11790 [Lysinibacillus sp. NPDC097287]|uniref:hypothetical protein n=1 Tax=Lysinibacillus sp. NPDC097287 TaxID=3364144 RepID=UPI00380A9F88